MKEINIARAIINKRKEKGITQEELASHIGVSSASVSKWETSQSYPDIVLLPQLAAYFNISVDELIGYEPQMTKQDITKLYQRLYEDLSNKPFDEIIRQCREVIKKYYSCFPLLLQMGELLMNSAILAGDSEKVSALIAEAKELFARVKKESGDAELIRSALYMEATCAIHLGNPGEIIELLEDTIVPLLPGEILLATAYRMTEKNEQAETTLQVGIYQNIISALNMLVTYAMFEAENADKLDEIVKRTLSLAETFNIKELQPSELINLYIVAANGYMMGNDAERALELLEEYAELMVGDISMRFESDEFFNLIDNWLSENGTAKQITPHEAIKQSLVDAVVKNPLFSALDVNPRFKSIMSRLESVC